MRKKMLQSILVVLIMSVVLHMVRTSYKTYQSSKRVDNLENEITVLKDDNVSIQKEIEVQDTPYYVEQVARNKLNMVLPNETLVVVRNSEVHSKNTEMVSEMKQYSPFDLWKKLFFSGISL